jgi:hypothetical protein
MGVFPGEFTIPVLVADDLLLHEEVVEFIVAGFQTFQFFNHWPTPASDTKKPSVAGGLCFPVTGFIPLRNRR